MKHLASLVKDGRVQYAIVDDESGQLVPFAEIVLPFPDRFGLSESAVLGTNLVDAIGLNGAKRGRPAKITTALPPADQPQLELEEEASTPEPPRQRTETAHQRRLRKQRETYARKRAAEGYEVAPTSERGVRPKHKRGRWTDEEYAAAGRRYIADEEIFHVINQHPEGVTTKAIANTIWWGEGPAPDWLAKTVENRVVKHVLNLKQKGTQLPFRQEHRPRFNEHGKQTGLTERLLLPNQGDS